MPLHLFQKIVVRQPGQQADFIQGTIPALSYLETVAFKEECYLLRAAIRLSREAAKCEQGGSFKGRDIKQFLKELVDQL